MAQAMTQTLHATCVASKGQSVLIFGASGSGKSSLALQLMAIGAWLVADDRVILRRCDDRLIADAPEALRGKIEARGVGILAAEPYGPAPIRFAIDMDEAETDRLPPLRSIEFLGCTLPLLRKSASPHFTAAVLTYLHGERIA